MSASVVGFYSLPFFGRIRPVYSQTSMVHIILNCSVLLILSSALPILSRTLGEYYLSQDTIFATRLHVCQGKTDQSAQPASVAQLDAPSDWRPGGRGFNPRRGRQHSFVEIDHEIFSMVILSLPLIQEGQLSVSVERMCTILVNRLED